MLTTLAKRNQRGFTLIELMVVIAIIGVLAAIAIPTFHQHRKKSYDSASASDLKNATSAQEAYFVDMQTYSAAIADLTGTSYGVYTSQGVTVSVVSATADTYQMTAAHSSENKTGTIVGPGGSITG